MKISTAHKILKSLNPEQVELLRNAHSRYMVLVGLYQAEHEGISAECAAQDKEKYPHFIRRDKGVVVTDQNDFASFAGDLTGLSSSMCVAWDEKAFLDEHGVSADEYAERQRRRVESEKLRIEHELVMGEQS